MKHYSVMLEEAIENLNIKPDGIYVDATLGRGGHSKEIARRLTTGKLIAFDKDLTAIAESKENLKDYLDRIIFVHDDFSNLKNVLNENGYTSIDGFLMDLGVSSPQFDDASRGFSYRFDARLDMRMDQTQELDAYKIVNEYEFNDLMRILVRYGEEKFAKQIARKIEKHRAEKPIETTNELVEIIKEAYPAKALSKKGHPAKQTFQALRIEVNHELESLENGLKDALSLLNINGRGCVITFHSLEDRITKEIFNEKVKVPYVDKRIPLKAEDIEKPSYQLISRKPIYASKEELEENNRSHSAKLRVIERVAL